MFQTKNKLGQNWRLEKRNFKRMLREKWERGGAKGFREEIRRTTTIPMSRYPHTRRALNWI